MENKLEKNEENSLKRNEEEASVSVLLICLPQQGPNRRPELFVRNAAQGRNRATKGAAGPPRHDGGALGGVALGARACPIIRRSTLHPTLSLSSAVRSQATKSGL